MGFSAFPKIFSIGQDYIADLFKDDVEVTEKVDGSQWVFGRVSGELHMRSKGKEQHAGAVDRMFDLAADYVLSLDLPNNVIFYGEYLRKPKHNTLAYECVPQNNIAVFGASTPGGTFVSDWRELADLAASIGLEAVPLLYRGKVEAVAQLQELLATDSYLGGTTVEGVVAKNYQRPFLLGGQPIPLMCGKYVSEAFKEKHQKNWGIENTARGKWDVFQDQYRSEARWEKAVQHLRDDGRLENAPRDIGPLIKEIQRDITEEEIDTIKDFLWREFGGALLRKSVAGAPEWYKERLMADVFADEKEADPGPQKLSSITVTDPITGANSTVTLDPRGTT